MQPICSKNKQIPRSSCSLVPGIAAPPSKFIGKCNNSAVRLRRSRLVDGWIYPGHWLLSFAASRLSRRYALLSPPTARPVSPVRGVVEMRAYAFALPLRTDIAGSAACSINHSLTILRRTVAALFSRSYGSPWKSRLLCRMAEIVAAAGVIFGINIFVVHAFDAYRTR
jgi:hypothetical protein